MTKKFGFKRTGIIAAGLAILLTAGTSMAAYAAVSRPSTSGVSIVEMEDGTTQFRVDSENGTGMMVIVTEDGEIFEGYSKECFPEELLDLFESRSAIEVRMAEDGTFEVLEGGVVRVLEGGILHFGATPYDLAEHHNGVERIFVTEEIGGILVMTEDGIMTMEPSTAE